jgi:hypothetical protein
LGTLAVDTDAGHEPMALQQARLSHGHRPSFRSVHGPECHESDQEQSAVRHQEPLIRASPDEGQSDSDHNDDDHELDQDGPFGTREEEFQLLSRWGPAPRREADRQRTHGKSRRLAAGPSGKGGRPKGTGLPYSQDESWEAHPVPRPQIGTETFAAHRQRRYSGFSHSKRSPASHALR